MKSTLHTRRAGAAQALLGKNRRSMAGASAGAARVAQMGRAQKLANAKSKMKMIDVTEVRGLNQSHQQRDTKLARKENAKQRLLVKFLDQDKSDIGIERGRCRHKTGKGRKSNASSGTFPGLESNACIFVW